MKTHVGRHIMSWFEVYFGSLYQGVGINEVWNLPVAF